MLHFSESLCIFFEPGLILAIFVPSIMNFFSTVIASDVVQIYPGSMLLIFSVAFVVPSFPALLKHDMDADPVGLGISMKFIIMLIV